MSPSDFFSLWVTHQMSLFYFLKPLQFLKQKITLCEHAKMLVVFFVLNGGDVILSNFLTKQRSFCDFMNFFNFTLLLTLSSPLL